MDTPEKLLLCTFFCFSFLIMLPSENGRVQGSPDYHNRQYLFHFRPSKLFVFGDSYVDTGNNRKSIASSWKAPYGITFPGKPTGRFSDGRVFTDFLARFIGVKSPIAYRWRSVGVKHWKYGMNFAFGGTGVFNTWAPDPNMTTQIDFFQQVIDHKIYCISDLNSSVALLSLAGNDYSTYTATNSSPQGLKVFITQVVNQLGANMKRINGMGVKKVVVGTLPPLGCLPRRTILSSFQHCNGTENELVHFHNHLLRQVVAKLNNETKDPTTSFLILDLYSAFMTVFQNKGKYTGAWKFENPLKPCCGGISAEYECGDVDKSGEKKYTVCDDPKSAFFWDTVHPTQEGWRVVYSALQAPLLQL